MCPEPVLFISKWGRMAAALALAVVAGCSAGGDRADRCLLDGSPAPCPDVLVACAAATGRTPLEICRVACERGDDLIYVCRTDHAGTEDGLFPQEAAPDESVGAALDGRVHGLSCGACLLWGEDGACSPGHTFCGLAPPTAGGPQAILRCDEQGRSASPVGECTAGMACVDPAGSAAVRDPAPAPAPGSGTKPDAGQTDEDPGELLPPARFGEARCEAAACDPGVLRCPADSPGIEVCSPAGDSWMLWTACPAGTAARCGPDPVCLPVPGTPCQDGCQAAQRCSLPGLFGEPRSCAAAVGEGQACSGDTDRVCQEGLRCVVEAPRTATAPPPSGTCRPACTPQLDDCPQGMTCLATAAGGVCSAAVPPGARQPCHTGLAGVCARGVRSPDGACLQLVTPAGADICDGLDNDCDGDVDEQATPPQYVAPCPSTGVCKDQPATCAGGRWVCAYPPTWEADETSCDGLDNDCDGERDEGCEEG